MLERICIRKKTRDKNVIIAVYTCTGSRVAGTSIGGGDRVLTVRHRVGWGGVYYVLKNS